MSQKAVFIVSALLFILAALATFTSFFYFSPQQVFKRKFGFELPESAKIVKTQYSPFGEQRLMMKVMFPKNDLPQIDEELRGYFKGKDALIIQDAQIISKPLQDANITLDNLAATFRTTSW